MRVQCEVGPQQAAGVGVVVVIHLVHVVRRVANLHVYPSVRHGLPLDAFPPEGVGAAKQKNKKHVIFSALPAASRATNRTTLRTCDTHTTTSPFVTENVNSNQALGPERSFRRHKKLQSVTSIICLGTMSPPDLHISFIYLPLPPSADVNTHNNRHNQDYQQDQRHDDSDAPWETDRGQMVCGDEERLKGGGGRGGGGGGFRWRQAACGCVSHTHFSRGG